MLPFTNLNRDVPVMEARPSKLQMLANRLFYWYFKLRAERKGFHNDYEPEPTVTSALAEKSLQLKERADWDVPLKDSRYIIFDTETTGFYPYQGDEIINIAAVVIENGEIKEDQIFDELVNPHRSIPQAVCDLTGITDDMVADKCGICSVLSDFLDFIGDSVLVAHNAEFDLAFLNIKLNWYTQTEIYNPVIDTYKLGRALYPQLLSHDLDTLIRHHRVKERPRHTALGDSLMTAEIFLDYLKKLEKEEITTLKQLYYYLHLKDNLAFCT
ncbi:3'-5' exonuclease [Dethiobacter alkaliphilus]|uniref:DNA polymerase III, epsilon subunit n=1 Tax=Dethiobacter alkaliphilus AHT 1 TaxID=555088 RepID=C0GHD8_DETAL|nr:exonuclease domain-containing protein [Dethiobacter alkaliphilus]EEG77144.1 DNA polymerase III, epsilon subunit [Dethiobacter alkaliphilus AHT 1]